MKRNLITSSLAALSVAFLLPMGAHAATTTNATTAKHHTAAKSATATKATTTKNASAAKTEATTPAKSATATKKHHHAAAKNAAASKKIDVNSATKDELMTLPGMDSDTADKIIAGRP
jgi:competence protein ComEA